MKSKTALFVAFIVLGSAAVFGQGQPQTPQKPPTDSVAPAIPGVVAGGTKVLVIKDGFQNSEGPVALPDGGILFTETRASRITKIDVDGNASTFLENANGSNGLGFDPKGRLISVQTTPGKARVGVLYPKGSERVLADTFENKPLVRPNDLVVDTKGGVYFTDSPGVYYINPGGKLTRVTDGIQNPNGVQLSPDEKILYANNKDGEYLLAFDVQPDGTLRNRRNFAKYVSVKRPTDEDNGADGLAVDAEGRVYVATNLGVEVFSPQGQHLGTIPVSRKAQNLAFSGRDKKTLYIVGGGAAFKIQTLAQGFKGRAK
jgi:gluconolactonase